MKTLTNYEKMTAILGEMKMILNDRVCDGLLFSVNGYVEEERQKAKDLVISPELQELDALFKSYQQKVRDAKQGHGPGGTMDLQHITKRIKEIYGS